MSADAAFTRRENCSLQRWRLDVRPAGRGGACLMRGAMHELPATEGMLQVALEAAAAAGATRVIAVDVVVGELTSMVDDSVQFYFDILSRDTAAAGATLRFRRDTPVASCSDCGARTAVRPPLSGTCAACGGMNIRVEGGRAFFVESIEVDDEGTGGSAGTEGE